jgi:hypothetical protein
MPPTGETLQHAARIVLVGRLAQDVAIHDHDGVGAQHREMALVRSQRGAGGIALRGGDPAHIVRRFLPRGRALIQIDRAHLQRDAQALEQLPPSR